MKRITKDQLNGYLTSLADHVNRQRSYIGSGLKQTRFVSEVKLNVNGEEYYFLSTTKVTNKYLLIDGVYYRGCYLSDKAPNSIRIASPMFIDKDVFSENERNDATVIVKERVHLKSLDFNDSLKDELISDLKNYKNDVDNKYLFKIEYDNLYKKIEDIELVKQSDNHLNISFNGRVHINFVGLYNNGFIFTNHSPTSIVTRLNSMSKLYLESKAKELKTKGDDTLVMECIEILSNVKRDDVNVGRVIQLLRNSLLFNI